MDKSILDLSTDIIKGVLDDVGVVVRDDARNMQPYQSVKVKPMDMVAKYMAMQPEVKQAVMQANPEGWQKYENDVLKIMEGMKNAAVKDTTGNI